MRRLVELQAGSHLYGTATAHSDIDLKSVHLPSARDLLLQRARPTTTERRGGASDGRDRPTAVDHEAFSLQRFLDLVLAGQPLALELLFSPDAAMTAPPDPLWREVQALAPRLVSRQASVFLRYCRQQAERFGAKGARAAAARRGLAMLRAAEATHGSTARLGMVEAELAALAAETPHAALVEVALSDGRRARHLELCGRMAALDAAIAPARAMAERLLAGYGERALLAERQGGADWKALSHAVRVGQEAVELLGTGRLRFPLAGAEHLIAIRLGQVPLGEVEAEIKGLVTAVEAAAAASILPEQPDVAAAEALVLHIHRQQVLEDQG